MFVRLFVNMRGILSPLEEIERLVPKQGNILDVGCGHGLFTNYMAYQSSGRRIVAVDRSLPKILVAKSTEKFVPNARYFYGDINIISAAAKYDVITIIDVLYLIPAPQQEIIFRKCFQLLKDDGMLIIKTQDTKPFIKYMWTQIEENIMTAFGLTHGDGLHYLPVEIISGMLHKAHYTIDKFVLPSKIFYSNIALVCKKAE